MTRENIKALRKLKNLSQAALGRLTNLSASDISRIECGYRTLTDDEAATLAAVLEADSPAPAQPPERAKTVKTARAPKGMSAAASVAAAPEKVEAPKAIEVAKPVEQTAAPAVAVAPKPLPTGDDLNDPANFGTLPNLEVLAPGSLDREAFRARLSTAIARANTILHTPRVPAAVWRAWRQFEQQGTALLRETLVDAPLPVRAAPVVAPVTAAEIATAPASAEAKGESKSFNSLFVEAARSILPAPLVQRFNEAAEAARNTDPSMGFMKHFRQIAEGQLEPALLKQVVDEANVRSTSADRSRSRRGRGR